MSADLTPDLFQCPRMTHALSPLHRKKIDVDRAAAEKQRRVEARNKRIADEKRKKKADELFVEEETRQRDERQAELNALWSKQEEWRGQVLERLEKKKQQEREASQSHFSHYFHRKMPP